MEKICRVLEISKLLVKEAKTQKEQEIKHLNNKRCKEPTFAYARYLLECLAEKLECEKPTGEETEKIIRAMW